LHLLLLLLFFFKWQQHLTRRLISRGQKTVEVFGRLIHLEFIHDFRGLIKSYLICLYQKRLGDSRNSIYKPLGVPEFLSRTN
jgi:hypothetical protein